MTGAALLAADRLRQAQRWPEALQAYQRILYRQPTHAVAAHNCAVCHMALGQWAQALQRSQQAQRLNPAQWASGLLAAMALHRAGQKTEALAHLQQLHRSHPSAAPIALELGRRLLHTLGDPLQSAAAVAPLLGHPQHGPEARQMTLLAQLYDRPADLSAPKLNTQLLQHARQHLGPAALPPAPQPHPPHLPHLPNNERPHIGIIGNQLHSSPVYYLAIGALRHMAARCDITVFDRSTTHDWASDEFRRIATRWVNVQALGAAELATRLRQHPVHALIDLCGWMDPTALQALASRPAPRQFTWVGGQSVSTGQSCFDGFISDEHHTPPGSEALYTEPLLRLAGGYVSYTPPPYLPALQAPPADRLQLGLICNPAKLSGACLQHIRSHWHSWQARCPRPITLQLIDHRYRIDALRQRVAAQLQGLPLQFITPDSHAQYLAHIGRLHAVIDSWPYSGGLTTLEAHSLGVPVYTRSNGLLFSERHSHAHNQYLGLPLPDVCSPDFSPAHALQVDRADLARRAQQRQQHALLAQQLLTHTIAH